MSDRSWTRNLAKYLLVLKPFDRCIWGFISSAQTMDGRRQWEQIFEGPKGAASREETTFSHFGHFKSGRNSAGEGAKNAGILLKRLSARGSSVQRL